MNIKENNFYCIDCLKGIDLLDDNSIDLVLTSPPYNIIKPNRSDRGYDIYNDGMPNEEYSNWLCEIVNKLDKKLKENRVILLNLNYGSENSECMNLTIADILRKTNFTLGDIIIWKKKNAMPVVASNNHLTRICEFIYVLCRKNEQKTYFANKKVISIRGGVKSYKNIYNFIETKNNDFSTSLNKATFSSEMVAKLLLLYSKEKDLVLDPFMGTGTTAVACRECNRQYIGFEISEKQVDFSKKRCSQMTIFDI